MKFKIENPLAFWYKLAKSLAVVGILIWLAETVYFLLLEGWHWRATNPLEVWCDGVVNSCFGGVFFAMMMCLNELIEHEVERQKNFQKIMDRVKKEAVQDVLRGLTDDDLEPLVKPFQPASFTISVFKDGEIKPLPCDCEQPCDGCKGLPGVQCQNPLQQ